MQRRLEESWSTFRAAVGLQDAPAVQLIEMRRAFFAGAESFFRIQLAEDDTVEPTAADLAVLDDLNAEIIEFAENVAAGVA